MTAAIAEEFGRIPMSPFLKETLARAADYAAAQMHREVTLEHLLLALAEDPEASVVLKSSQVDIQRLMSDVSNYLGRMDDRVDGTVTPAAAISGDLRRILEASAAAASQGRRREINGAIVLAAIVGDGKSPAAHMLRSQGLTFEQAIRALQQAASTPPAPAAGGARNQNINQPQAPAPRAATTDDIMASARERVATRTAPPAPPMHIEPPAPVDSMAEGMAQASRDANAGAAPPPPPSPVPYPNARQRSPSPDVVASPSFDNLPPPPPVAPAPAAAAASAAANPGWAPPPPPPQRSPFPPMNGPRPQGGAPAPLPPFPPATQGSMGAPPLPGSAPPPGYGQQPMARPPSAPWTEQGGQTGAQRGPSYDDAMARLDARRPQQGQGAGQPQAAPQQQRRAGSATTVQAGQLVENIPRKMRVGLPVIVEARVARAEVKAIADGLQGDGAVYRHEVTVTKAMSVRLKAPDGGFTIETASPETQWIENVLGLMSNDYASWRWSVIPQQRGKRRLQLVISARTVGTDGLTAETALPDQIIDVSVGINYARTLAKWATWAAAAIAGGLLSHFGDTIFEFGKTLLGAAAQ